MDRCGRISACGIFPPGGDGQRRLDKWGGPMIQIIDTSPDVQVDPAEYQRLLGYPRDHAMSERARELAAAAREWYWQHGRPWFYARQVERLEIEGGRMRIDGVPFSSQRLAVTLRQAEA